MERVRDTGDETGNENTGMNGSARDRNCADAQTLNEQICRADLLRYIGDMAEELQSLCASTGCSTLAGLLALARTEAMLQQDHSLQRLAG
jgi:hypothetical protein